jgi:hypothetical protein
VEEPQIPSYHAGFLRDKEQIVTVASRELAAGHRSTAALAGIERIAQGVA